MTVRTRRLVGTWLTVAIAAILVKVTILDDHDAYGAIGIVVGAVVLATCIAWALRERPD